MADLTRVDVADTETTSREAKGKAPLLATPPGLVAKGMAALRGHEDNRGGYKRGIAIVDFVLRLSTLAVAIAATAIMGTTDQTLPFFTQFFQFQASYDDLPAFQFFVVAMAIACVYLALSIAFSIVCIIRPHAAGPRLLLIFFDIVTLVLTTAAAGSSAAIVYLAHNGNSSANWLAICQQFDNFCQKTSGAVVASFVAMLGFMFLVVLSAVALKRH
ncbi:hypothetical protein RHSIM_Rhsim03G0069900 [Rhododendron simsii]|uniref:CASP-like protein n=1 Tax=Rhododendron simsii TaxID=118357 RepID=A0A834HGT6_RHOSS|nr:hypothetical protein RHSIM_Rhsim03G0069900 [Rhododendron simsii]